MILGQIAVGDKIDRRCGDNAVMMTLTVTAVKDDRIACGDWEFDKATGLEIDDFLEWGPAYSKSGTYATPAPKGQQ